MRDEPAMNHVHVVGQLAVRLQVQELVSGDDWGQKRTVDEWDVSDIEQCC